MQNLIINSVTRISLSCQIKLPLAPPYFCIVMDTIKHQGMRKNLINALRNKELYEESVLDAMNLVPRHLFIDSSAFLEFAYQDAAFPIGAGQTISHPSTVAWQTSLLNVKKGERVLEIGTGCGFQTAVLCELKVKVYTIERQRELYMKTKRLLPEMGYRAHLYYGDGYKGIPQWAPYDKVIVTCGAPKIPEDLLAQLVVGGVMVVPVGEGTQTMMLIEKRGEDEYDIQECGDFSFVPMLPDRDGLL